jgi:hypothetical protein
VRRAPFGPQFADVRALLDALDKTSFPGYGWFFANQLPHSKDKLELAYIEIPQRGLNRYFVIEQTKQGGLAVVTDFVARDAPEITRVRREGGVLVYLTQSGQVVNPQRVP